MKITLEHYGQTFSAEDSRDDLNIVEVRPLLVGLLVAAGFHPDTVEEILPRPE